MKDTIRINFEFPREHYPYLKMLCAKKGISLREYASELLIQSLEDFEDAQLAALADDRLKDIDEDNLISFDEACREAGWNVE